jgi:hypothetical protein
VTVDLHDDGSGVVTVRATLDAQAVAEAEVGGGNSKTASTRRSLRDRLEDLAVVRSGSGTADRALEAVLPTGSGGRDHRRGERAERPGRT